MNTDSRVGGGAAEVRAQKQLELMELLSVGVTVEVDPTGLGEWISAKIIDVRRYDSHFDSRRSSVNVSYRIEYTRGNAIAKSWFAVGDIRMPMYVIEEVPDYA